MLTGLGPGGDEDRLMKFWKMDEVREKIQVSQRLTEHEQMTELNLLNVAFNS